MLGGFASQLRQFNIAYSLSKDVGTEVGLDLSDYDKGYFRPYVLDYLLLPSHEIVGKEALTSAFHATCGRELLEWYENSELRTRNIFIDGEATDFNSFFDKYPDFWVSSESELFKHIELKEKSSFVDEFSRMNPQNMIGIHVRLGDFTEIGWDTEIGIYQAKLGYYLDKYQDAKVVVFSNDVVKAKEMFINDDRFYFMNHHNGYIGDIEEFLCFSMCKYKILSAKSGYSKLAELIGVASYDAMPEKVFDDEEIKLGLEAYDKLSTKNKLDNPVINEHVPCDDDCSIVDDTVDCSTADGYSVNGCMVEECHILGDSIPKEKRPDVMIKNKDCFKTEEVHDFWQSYYGEKSEANVANVYISYKTSYNRWFYQGLYKEAIKSARLGGPTLYIAKRNKITDKTETDKLLPAVDLDGENLDFTIYLRRKGKAIKKIINDWKNENKLTDVRVIQHKESLTEVFRKIISKLLKR